MQSSIRAATSIVATLLLLPSATAQTISAQQPNVPYTVQPGYTCAIPTDQLIQVTDETIVDAFTCQYNGYCWTDWNNVDLLTVVDLGYFTYSNPANCYYAVPLPNTQFNTTVNNITAYSEYTPSNTNSDVYAMSDAVVTSNSPTPQNVSGAVCDATYRVQCVTVGGDAITDADTCGAAGCCFEPTFPQSINNTNNSASYLVPSCFYSSLPTPTYYLSAWSQINTTYQTGTLTLYQRSNNTGNYGDNYASLDVTVQSETSYRVRIKVSPTGVGRYEVPGNIIAPTYPSNNPNITLQYNVSTSTLNDVSMDAWIAVTRVSDGVVIFNATAIQFADQYLQTYITLPDAPQPHLYGLGERVEPNVALNGNNHTVTLWNVDQGANRYTNQYGSHPFYTQIITGTGASHTVYLKNSNGIEILFYNQQQLRYSILGGVLDWYVFTGPTPELATQQYHELIGTPALPPYTSLGWHQCRYGFPNIQTVQTVVANYSANDIPLEYIWLDIDHMDRFQDFTLDPIDFPASEVLSFAQQIHSNNQKIVVILDPGIHVNQSVATYTEGKQADVFLKLSDGTTDYVGRVWPGIVNFPDFLANGTIEWWSNQVQRFANTSVPVDGLWIDMNEISNFNQTSQDYSANNTLHYLNNPRYRIVTFGARTKPLNSKTIPMTLVHRNAYEGQQYYEYDLHNLYGLSESIATRQALINYQPGQRPFVLTRSTAPSSGHYVSMWLGDDNAVFNSLQDSLVGTLVMNQAGVTQVGADIGGFNGATNQELVARWTSAGVLSYTFARNHKDIHSDAWYPYNDTVTADVARITLNARYTLLPYLNTLMVNAYFNGGTVVRAVPYNYAYDTNTYDISDQLMWGAGTMVAPIIYENTTSRNVYLPPSNRWYEWDFSALVDGEFTEVTQTGNITVTNITLTDIPFYVAGGNVIPLQPSNNSLTIAALNAQPYKILVALDVQYSAYGELFLDNGVDLNVGAYAVQASYVASSSQLTATISQNNAQIQFSTIGSITILGLSNSTQITNVTLNGAAIQSFKQAASGQLDITGLNQPVNSSFVLTYCAGACPTQAPTSTSTSTGQLANLLTSTASPVTGSPSSAAGTPLTNTSATGTVAEGTSAPTGYSRTLQRKLHVE